MQFLDQINTRHNIVVMLNSIYTLYYKVVQVYFLDISNVDMIMYRRNSDFNLS